jgi:tetratricopeptide (TPR) repeat protein
LPGHITIGELKLNPALAATYYNRGKLNLETGAEGRAIEDFKKALKIDPDIKTAYRKLSRLLKSKSEQPSGKYAKALAQKSQN